MSILDTCQVNDVVGVVYGDKPEERICRVLAKRDLQEDEVSRKSCQRRPELRRRRFLVTCQGKDGRIRSFYAGNEQAAREITPLKAAILRLRGKLPPRKLAKPRKARKPRKHKMVAV